MTSRFKTPLNDSFAIQILVFMVSFIVLLKFSTRGFASNDLSDLSLILIVLFLFTKTEKLQFNPRLAVGFLLISLVGIGASSNSEYQEVSFARLTVYRDFLLFGFCIYLVFRDRLLAFAPLLLASIVAVFLCITPITLTEYFNHTANLTNESVKHISPELSYYGHIRHYSYHGFIATCCATILALLVPKYKQPIAAVTLICLIATVLSSGRAAILSCGIFFVLIFAGELGWRKSIQYIALSISMLIILFVALYFTPFSAVSESLLLRSQQLTNPDHLLSGRITFWTSAIEALSDSPMLGLGPDGYLWSKGRHVGSAHPHNSLVQVYLEYGYFGGSIILILVALMVAPLFTARTHISRYEATLHNGLNQFFIAYLIYALVDGLFYHTLPLVHISILIPVWVALWKSRSEQHK